METSPSPESAAAPPPPPPLHTSSPLRRTPFYRIFAALYALSLSALFYRHILTLLSSQSKLLPSLLLLSDLSLSLQWASAQCFRLRPIRRSQFPSQLQHSISPPPVDIFICTADPYKEPPIGVLNTALSLLAYDYPPDKLSVYVSDDGASQLTLFALLEAARFASRWLPFCRENGVDVRSPEAYFNSGDAASSPTHNIKMEVQMLYEDMKMRVEDVMEKGKVSEEYLHSDQDRAIFTKWTPDFTRQHHPTIIQVLLDSNEHKDEFGQAMPNFIYVAREKSRSCHHNFKAGSLNTLIRVSGAMTNAPIILTQDCDMFSNDPQTIWRVLCYFLDPVVRPTLGYIQFPQIFNGLNKNDIYACEHKRLYQINPMGLDGFQGPNYLGSNCFFQRRTFFGPPSSCLELETPEISPDRVVESPLQSTNTLDLAHCLAIANYEHGTLWGSKIGIRYGSLSEDYYTANLLLIEGWRGIFCDPKRAAFLGDAPSTLIDQLSQRKRWIVGLLMTLFSKCSPITSGTTSMGLFMGLGYSHYALEPIWAIPLTIYAFIPQLALLNGISLFPKLNDPWILLYIFLFLGAYGQDLFDFLLANSTFQRWWNSQRMWMFWGVSSFLFGCTEYSLAQLGISMVGFTVTSKLQEDDLTKRYEQGMYEFGVDSPMFVSISMAAIVSLVGLGAGIVWTTIGGVDYQGLVLQMLLCGYVVVNSWPVYEAMVVRKDRGRLPTKTTAVAAFQAVAFCLIATYLLKLM